MCVCVYVCMQPPMCFLMSEYLTTFLHKQLFNCAYAASHPAASTPLVSSGAVLLSVPRIKTRKLNEKQGHF